MRVIALWWQHITCNSSSLMWASTVLSVHQYCSAWMERIMCQNCSSFPARNAVLLFGMSEISSFSKTYQVFVIAVVRNHTDNIIIKILALTTLFLCCLHSVTLVRCQEGIWLWNVSFSHSESFPTDTFAPCGLRGCKNGPAPFPGRMSYKATKPGLVSVLYLSIFFIVLVFIRAPFYVLLVFIVCFLCFGCSS